VVGKHTFIEEVLPVESVAQYFEHFPILIDFTFHSLLKDQHGKPAQNFKTLRAYSQYLQEGGWHGRLCFNEPPAHLRAGARQALAGG
jgi:hypothetical protein